MDLDDVHRDAQRRERVRAIANGIDYVDVHGNRSVLTVHFFNAVPDGLAPAHFHLQGGSQTEEIRVLGVDPSRHNVEAPEKAIDLSLSRAADLTRYTLSISGVDGIDPVYSSASFSFAAEHPSLLDCAAGRVDAVPPYPTPEIDYLAKDYASFRQLMLDRLATAIPSWTERQVPDIGMAIVEILAYVGDYLSYYQDAVATEAYLRTARRRVSVRRHAKLVDYAMHEGCNARAWLHFKSSTDRAIDLADTLFITSCRATAFDGTAAITIADLERVPATEYEVFEAMTGVGKSERRPVGLARQPVQMAPTQPSQLFQIVAAHSEMHFYTWGSATCWLREGATSSTLLDSWVDDRPANVDGTRSADRRAQGRSRMVRIAPGDILIFEETVSPVTGSAADADPAHRHAVCLTRVDAIVDPLYDSDRGGRPVVNITWSDADALPFDLCLAILGPAPACRYLGPDPDRPDRIDIAVALGNVLLVDHGRSVAEAAEAWQGMIGEFATNSVLVNVPSIAPVPVCEGVSRPLRGLERAARFEPTLGRPDLTFSVPQTGKPKSAAAVALQDPRLALPRVTFDEARPGFPISRWSPRIDLLDSDPIDRHFVVEVDDDRVARVRFGEALGAGSRVRAQYRVGNGQAGNVGAESIRHIVSRGGFVSGAGLDVRNPLPAVGGVDPEPTADVRLRAPFAFKATLERAVTADDYARLAERHPQVQRASASVAWNGSRASVVVAIDPLGRVVPEPNLLTAVKRFLFRYRRIGHDLEVVSAAYVPLALVLDVGLQDGYLRGQVLKVLLDTFSSRRLPGGALGFFHPDRLTFGDNVYPSQIVSAAQRLDGVDRVAIRVLTRYEDQPESQTKADISTRDAGTTAVLQAGVLVLAPFEIARLDNDPTFPEHGVLTVNLWGGR